PRSQSFPAMALLLGLLLISLSIPTAMWDARTTWLFHAKRMYLSGSFYEQLDGYPPWSHPDYPSLGPAMMASLARCVGSWNEIFPKSANMLLAIAPVLVLASALRSAIWILAFSCAVVALLGENLVYGNMDGLLALYFTAAAWLISLLFHRDTES